METPICSICLQEVHDNVSPETILTCARCVQNLLIKSIEDKKVFKDKLLEQGREEAARSVEAFIPDEGDMDIATIKRTIVLRRSNHHLTPFKTHFKTRSQRLGANNGKA